MKPKVKALEKSGAFALHGGAFGLVRVHALPFAKPMPGTSQSFRRGQGGFSATN